MLRNWRNSPEVSNFMEYREHITQEMQEKWFKSVDNINNLYFIFQYKGEDIGVINGKDINWATRRMETGIFVANRKYLNTQIPLMAVLTFAELGVVILNATATAHILRDNTRAKKYNKLIGFRLEEGQEDVYNQLYIMTKDTFLHNSKTIRKAMDMIMGKPKIILTFENHDIESGFADQLFNELNDGSIKKVETTDNSKTLYF